MSAQAVHDKGLTKSAYLTSFQVPSSILPPDVIRVLNKEKVSFVLVGAYGLVGWRKEARATEDVNIVVSARQIKKAVRVLLTAFPNLEAVDLPVVTRLRERGTENVLIDVMKPVQQPYVEVFKHTKRVTSGGQSYLVPSLEMALMMKFSSMTSVNRAVEDKYQDAHDFILMAKGNPDFNKDNLAELGRLLYADAGKDVLEMTRKALAGETLNL